MPLGVGFLISVLRQEGHKVDFVDLYLKNTPVPRVDKYDLVGISANTVCYRGALSILNECKAARVRGWKGIIVIGGPHTSVCVDTIPEFVDHVVQGEGEIAITKIASGERLARIIREERIKDLDILPRPAYDVFAKLPYHDNVKYFGEQPVFAMNSSRGCPFNCTFCSVKSIWGKKWTCFSPERVVDDIEFLISDYGAKGIYFREDNFTVRRSRVEKICELILMKNINIKWATETRVDTINYELMSKMYKAGCRGLYFGIEATTQNLLDSYNKGITIEQINNAFLWAKQLGIHTYASFLIDTPQETLEDRLAILEFLERYKPSSYSLNHFTGIPNSKLYEKVLNEGSYLSIDDVGLVNISKKPFPMPGNTSLNLPKPFMVRATRALLHPSKIGKRLKKAFECLVS